MLQNNSINNLF